jgi:hypothetical protein
LSDSDRKRIDQLTKIWNFFGPTPENLAMKQLTLPFPFNNRFLNPLGASPDYLMTLGTEVGPYLPAVAPQMREFSFKIINKLNERVYRRIIEDFEFKED